MLGNKSRLDEIVRLGKPGRCPVPLIGTSVFDFVTKQCLLFDILLLVSKSLLSHFVVVRYCCYNKNKHTKKEKNKKRILIALPFVNNNCGDATFFLERSL